MPRAAEGRPDRRREILAALYTCMRKQGYARTTLKDIAECAGMSPSHVGYYFENQGAILEAYAEAVCRQNLQALRELQVSDTATSIDRIAAFCFEEGQTTPGLLQVIQELSGLAVHDPRLRRIKRRHAVGWREFLEGVFESAPEPKLAPREAALHAHALLVGLNTNAVFDDALDRPTALALFRRELRSLAGIDAAAPRRAAPRGRKLPHRKARR